MDKYTWNFDEFCKNDKDFYDRLDKLSIGIKNIKDKKINDLYDTLKSYFTLALEREKLYTYAELNSDIKIGEEKYIKMKEELDKVYNNLKKYQTKIVNYILSLNKEKERSASFEVDILVKKDDGNYETIELNSTYDTIRIERNLGFISKVYSANYPENAYKKEVHIPSVRQINFCEKVLKSIDHNLIDEAYFTIKDTDIVLTDKVEIDIVNMDKINDKSYDYVNEREEKVAKWCKILLSSSSQEIKKELDTLMSEKDSKKIIDKVEELSKDDEIISLNDEYDRTELDKVSARNLGIEQGIIQGKAEGIKEGKEEGIKERNIAIAKNMLKEGLDANLISKVTGLSKEKVEKLKEA